MDAGHLFKDHFQWLSSSDLPWAFSVSSNHHHHRLHPLDWNFATEVSPHAETVCEGSVLCMKSRKVGRGGRGGEGSRKGGWQNELKFIFDTFFWGGWWGLLSFWIQLSFCIGGASTPRSPSRSQGEVWPLRLDSRQEHVHANPSVQKECAHVPSIQAGINCATARPAVWGRASVARPKS